MPRLKAILETGIDPGKIELGERLLLNLEEAYPGSIAYIEQALLRRKSLTELPEQQSELENNFKLSNILRKIWNVVASVNK